MDRTQPGIDVGKTKVRLFSVACRHSQRRGGGPESPECLLKWKNPVLSRETESRLYIANIIQRIKPPWVYGQTGNASIGKSFSLDICKKQNEF